MTDKQPSDVTIDLINQVIETNSGRGFGPGHFEGFQNDSEHNSFGCQGHGNHLNSLTPVRCVEQYLPDHLIKHIIHLSNDPTIPCTTEDPEPSDHIKAWYTSPPADNEHNDDDSHDDEDTIIPCSSQESEDEQDDSSSTTHTANITVSDLYLYLATVIAIMLAPQPELTDYFSTSVFFGNEFIKSIWSGRDHFLSVHRSVRVNPHYFTRVFNQISLIIWKPFPNVTVDETLIQFTGRFKFKQHIKGKPEDTGIKFYMMADDLWFVIRLWPYTGHQPQVHILVMDFVSFLPSHEYNICTDSYFGHHKTALLLNYHKFRFTMICPKNRLEEECKNLLSRYTLSKGEWIGVTNGDYVAIHYKDKKQITFLSNMVTLKKSKNKKKGAPKVKELYEKKHVNVDVADRYAHMYPGCHRVNKWTQAAWMGIFRIVLANSWIFYKKAKNTDIDYKSFLMRVAVGFAQKAGADLDDEGKKLYDVHMIQRVHDRHGHHCHHCNKYPTHTKCSQCDEWDMFNSPSKVLRPNEWYSEEIIEVFDENGMEDDELDTELNDDMENEFNIENYEMELWEEDDMADEYDLDD
ncbi:hypothetical protein C9374_014391 [Naegleria lovaniensis]|uniref:PiggyBac transposable element-derived protein domain-containing protein n=1 Tax=Naegleria lovaniensis TaxID=51637 RepID=A0AA88KPU5_NAELO|nr:uncharacterized protein C9374_014391 [Naegleria lovaniensis]KAG2388991.1 hypothetical protein C9374_014391 [Naegleria lovaniensis]